MSESNASEPVDHEAESDDNAAGQEGQDPEVALSDEGLAQSQEPEDPLAIAEAKAAENWEKYVRAVAELDNVRKRARRDVENAHKYGIERFAGELLAVTDSLEAGLAAGEAADAGALREGSEATLKLFVTTLTKFGIEQLDPHGEPFDPEQHEAMTMVPSPDVEPNTVIDVIQKGYSLNGRLIRPARVIVAAPSA
ncbi:MAG: nucleotide exchange factor GrpE [Pseudomonadota bacterium]